MIDYKSIIKKHSMNAIRDCISYVAQNGLSGDEHFYIVFRTSAPGVLMSEEMRKKFPREMMVVLQYQFDGLTANPSTFEVTLSFNGVSERLAVPYAAITGFYDPASDFNIELHENSQMMMYRCMKSENDDEADEYINTMLYGREGRSGSASLFNKVSVSEADVSDESEENGENAKSGVVIDIKDYIKDNK